MEERINSEELKKINALTRREMTADELYTFSVCLCDNDIDRQNERFTAAALRELCPMFIGKTGICDHNWDSNNQQARIYDCFVEEDVEKTVCGEKYTRLIAKCYMPKSEKSRELMLEIDSGIKKEVSVGCAVKSRRCSVCGKESRECSHIKGKKYNRLLCYDELSSPYDAYEWSFVAVPAQKRAGVIKHLDEIYESIRKGSEKITLEGEAINEIAELHEEAESGKRYLCRLKSRAFSLKKLSGSEIVTDSVIEKMNVYELEELVSALTKQAGKRYPIKPQLWTDTGDIKNDNYMI